MNKHLELKTTLSLYGEILSITKAMNIGFEENTDKNMKSRSLDYMYECVYMYIN